jgi:tetratricopeptide (TPR) repeat protein
MSDELRVDSGALIFATLADVYISSGMIDEAISILKDGLARNPSYYLAHVILGRAYYLKGDLEEAIKTFESVYDEIKDSEIANLYLGHCHRDSGEKEKARSLYEVALKINPENMDALKEIEKLIPDFTPPPGVRPVKPAEPEQEEVEAVTIPVSEDVTTETTAPSEELQEPAATDLGEKVSEEEISPAFLEAEPSVVAETPIADAERIEEIQSAESVIEELPEMGTEKETIPLEALDKPVRRLLDLDTVNDVLISTRDGLLIKRYGKAEGDMESICASVAAVCMDVDESFRLLKRGGLTRCIIEKPEETLCVMAVGDSLLTVITEVEAKPGLVFVYARKIIEEIEEILG